MNSTSIAGGNRESGSGWISADRGCIILSDRNPKTAGYAVALNGLLETVLATVETGEAPEGSGHG